MGVTLEILIIPVLLVTAVVLLTVFSDLHMVVVLAGGVFLGILYFVVVRLLKQEHEEDVGTTAPGEEELPAEQQHQAGTPR